MPAFSLILVSHNKPRFVREALRSVLDQTFRDWECILVDSGVLLGQRFFADVDDPRVRILPSGETPELARTRNMASWCFNQLLNRGEAMGELIMYLCDDDLLYPRAFEVFWRYYLDHGREPQAMYASQDIGLTDAEGTTKIIGRRLARKPAGRFCRGARLDARVDYLQFCHSAAILARYREVYGTTEYHSEDRRDASHADGIFMERIGTLTTVYPIPDVLSMNRRTIQSVNLDYAESFLGRVVVTCRQKVKGTWARFRDGRRW